MTYPARLTTIGFLVMTVLVLGARNFGAENPRQTGTLTGKVIDRSTNEPVVGASIVVVGTALGTSADANGNFRIDGIPIGMCSVRVSGVGYTPFVETDIVVSVAKPAQVSIGLASTDVKVETVDVTASYFQKISDTPVSTLTQSNEEIRRLPGGLEDVVRAISILPGVAQVQAGRNDLIVRGGAPSENLFIIDNIEAPNINHFGTEGSSGGPLSFINLDFIENTTFSTGGFGVRHGDKLSSVLDIHLRDGRTDEIGGKATISASQFGLNLEGPTDKSGDFVFSARRSYLDFVFKAAGLGFVPEYWDFLGKVHYKLGERDKLTILGVAALDDVRFFNNTAQQRYDNSRILGSNQNEAVSGATWQHLFDNGFTTVTLAETYMDFQYGQADSMLVPLFKNNSIERESSLRWDVLLHAFRATELSFGIQGKVPDFSSALFLRPFVTSYGDSLGVNASYGTTAFKGALYAQVSEDLGIGRITAGGRLDYFNLIENKFAFSPRASVTVPLDGATNVSASAGTYEQAPSYIWLVANAANRGLQFVKANQYIVGIDHTLSSDTRLSLELYRKDYAEYPASLVRPYLVLANTGAGFGGSEEGFASFGLDPLVSRGTGKATGAEFLAQKKFSEIPCYGTVSISYGTSRFTALDGVTRPSNWDQRWIVNVGGGYMLGEKWEFSAKFRFATGRPFTPYNPDGTQNIALYNTARVGVNHGLDIRVDRRWSLTSWVLVTYVDVQDVYNRKPVDVPIYNAETHALEQQSTIGILPSIGISAEF
ncbi:MAG TPA: TonB-dependent receptor [Bacteroidota bacterium]|nr:TonB-dependent receptor [Bacteroidota bacterium]